MKGVLEKCTVEDFNYISATLDSYVSFTNDKRRKHYYLHIKTTQHCMLN